MFDEGSRLLYRTQLAIGVYVEVSRRKARVHRHAGAVVVVMDCGEVGGSGMANLTRHCIVISAMYLAILFK
jgi:hypothetical protein